MEHEWFDQPQYEEKPSSSAVKHILVALMLIFTVAVLLLPLWQRGVNRSLEMEYRSLVDNRILLEERTQLLRASISTKAIPEAVSAYSWQEEIYFTPITAIVARGDL
ncbi:MAG: hypothetical protein GX313_08010 [Spirochaetales bacterium]|nr:hypothetical protein [Spirochaetales bacterium]